MVDVKVPTLGESITEAVIVRWLKGDGDTVEADEVLLELETEKATVEIPAEQAGVVEILAPEGATVHVGDVVARIDAGKAAAAQPMEKRKAHSRDGDKPSRAPAVPEETHEAAGEPAGEAAGERSKVTSLARRLATEHGIDTTGIPGTGRGGRVTKADVLARVDDLEEEDSSAAPAERSRPVALTPATAGKAEMDADEERVPMSPIRRRIAERLVEAQQTAAILTTFNEIDMSGVLALRRRYKESFKERHGVALGFMSFFARSCIAGLREVPAVNAEIRGTDVVYKKHVHLGIAVSTPKGLVVPVVHHADRLSFAEIETEIGRLAGRARDGKLSIDELTGGTFSITNGGVFGSLLSTPILNPPQSAILGMHKIEERPVVIDGQIVARPMMYVALSYDHRIIDGEQAVTFLVRVKERLEDPSRLLLDV